MVSKIGVIKVEVNRHWLNQQIFLEESLLTKIKIE